MSDIPMTSAIRYLLQNDVEFTPHFFKYEEKGGTTVSSRELGVSEHSIVKTLIMETDAKEPLIVLMHGDCKVSTKELARILGVRSIHPCKPDVADRHSGYQVGGTSPFGTKRTMPVYLESSILDLDEIYINGGGRGFLVKISPAELIRLLSPTLVNVGTAGK